MEINELKVYPKTIFIFFISIIFLSLIYFYFYEKIFIYHIYKSYRTLFYLIIIFIIFYSLIFNISIFRKFYLNTIDLINKYCFPSSEKEIYLYSIVRILFGFIILIRCINIFIISENFTLLEHKVIFVELFFSICLIFGLLSQYALSFFIFIMWTTDGAQLDLKAYTLGNDVGTMLAIFLLFAESGRFISLDSYLIKIKPKLTNYLLFKNNLNSKEFLSLLKFVCLYSYWCVCLYSVVIHLHDDFWKTGITGPLLLTSSYMSSMHNLFDYFFVNSKLLIIFFKISLIVMMFWYFLLLPFSLIGGLFKKIVVIWGLLFFIISDQILNLGSLGKIEYLLWVVLFWPNNLGLNKDGKDSIWVFYDDKCSLCDNTVRILEKLDFFSVLIFKPTSQCLNDLKLVKLNYEDAMDDMHGYNVKENKFYVGFDFYFICTKKIILLYPFFPIFLLAKYLKFGKIFYRFIATRRRRLFGTCQVRSISYFKKEQLAIDRRISHIRLSIISSIFISGFFFLFSMPIPLIDKKNYGLGIAGQASVFGIQHIDVFNKTDLKMSQNWFTLEILNKENNMEMIPFYNIDGSRGRYHKSERIYFGYSLAWRRNPKVINYENPNCLHNHNDFIHIYEKVVEIYLNENNINDGIYEFLYKQYNKKNPSDLLKKNIYSPYKTKIICTESIKFTKRDKLIKFIS